MPDTRSWLEVSDLFKIFFNEEVFLMIKCSLRNNLIRISHRWFLWLSLYIPILPSTVLLLTFEFRSPVPTVFFETWVIPGLLGLGHKTIQLDVYASVAGTYACNKISSSYQTEGFLAFSDILTPAGDWGLLLWGPLSWY